MVFTEKKINYEASNEIIIKLLKIINEYIDEIDHKVIYKRKTDFRSAFCYGLLYTRKFVDQLETSDIINNVRGFKTHPSSFKRRLDTVDFKIFDDLIHKLSEFDKENFNFSDEVIAVDGSHGTIITNNKLDINDDINKLIRKHKPIKLESYDIYNDINLKNNCDQIINFSHNPSDESMNIPILGVYNVTRKFPVALELAETKNERKAFLDYFENKNKLIHSYNNPILVYDRGYPSYKMMHTLIKSNKRFIVRLENQFKFRKIKKKKKIPGRKCKNIKENDKTKTIDENKTFTEIDEIRSFNYNEPLRKKGDRRLGSPSYRETFNIRYIHYRIKNKDYFIATNLYDKIKYPIEAIKLLYHKRWSIEEYFDLLKSSMKLGRYTTKKKHAIQLSMYMHQITTAILSILCKAYRLANTKTNVAVNSRNMLHAIYNLVIPELLKLLPFDKANIILQSLANTVNYVPIINGRQFVRKSKTPNTKWYISQHKKQKNKRNNENESDIKHSPETSDAKSKVPGKCSMSDSLETSDLVSEVKRPQLWAENESFQNNKNLTQTLNTNAY